MLVRFCHHELSSIILVVAISVFHFQPLDAIQLKVKIEHDMSKPSYGLLAPTSSHLTYDSRAGLKLKGTIQDILGPPVKVARGVKNILRGSGMGGLGASTSSSMRSGAAILGIDTHRLEQAGASNLLENGLLRSVTGVKPEADVADIIQDTPGHKIANIIEIPIRVPSRRNNSGRNSAGQPDNVASNGEALRQMGIKEIFEGASEGVQNLGSMVSRATGDASSAFRLLPMIIDMQREDYEQEQKQKQSKQNQSS